VRTGQTACEESVPLSVGVYYTSQRIAIISVEGLGMSHAGDPRPRPPHCPLATAGGGHHLNVMMPICNMLDAVVTLSTKSITGAHAIQVAFTISSSPNLAGSVEAAARSFGPKIVVFRRRGSRRHRVAMNSAADTLHDVYLAARSAASGAGGSTAPASYNAPKWFPDRSWARRRTDGTALGPDRH